MQESDPQGLLVIPHLRIQNANAVSSPLTYGFPAMTAFFGLMWALERKMAEAKIPLLLEKVGVICHDYEELTSDGYVKTFRLTRNPVGRDGRPAAIVEEGRTHLDVTLLFQVSGGDKDDPNNVLNQDDRNRCVDLAWKIRDLVETMRIAGGSVLPAQSSPGKQITPRLFRWSTEPEQQRKKFLELRRRWLPGFVLVGRDDFLKNRLAELREDDKGATLLDAWLDVSRLNSRSVVQEHEGADGKKVERLTWQHDRQPGSGWLVPMPVGYGALTSVYDGADVINARDSSTPFRFVESLYSIGQWISPHHLQRINDFFWHVDSRPDEGSYRCRSDYLIPVMSDDD